MSDEIHDFNRGSHSFYGMMRITIISGSPILNGATLYKGFISDIFAPVYGLPITFECTETFKMKIVPLQEDAISKREYSFYFPSKIPEGFEQLSKCIFYSSINHGATYPFELRHHIDSILEQKPSKIFIVGSKGVGKSTFARVLANKIISKYKKVAFLDIDPGQPEFSLPGSISLSILSSFILEPPEKHSKNNDISYYFGGTSVADNIYHFENCLKELVQHIPPDVFVIINSFGWIVDLGFELHQKFLEYLTPDHIIMLTKPAEQFTPIRDDIFVAQIYPKQSEFDIKPKDHRDLRITTYFTTTRTPVAFQQPKPINLRSIRIGFVLVDVSPSESLTALNGSVVSLCLDKRKFAKTDRLVTLLRDIPPLQCIGYGLVRAIDKRKGILYLITDSSPEDFNTIVMGIVHTPVHLYLDTPRSDPNYLGIGVRESAGASTEPLNLKSEQVFE